MASQRVPNISATRLDVGGTVESQNSPVTAPNIRTAVGALRQRDQADDRRRAAEVDDRKQIPLGHPAGACLPSGRNITQKYLAPRLGALSGFPARSGEISILSPISKGGFVLCQSVESLKNVGRASEYASSTTLVERPAHLFTKLLFTKLSLRPVALLASIGN